MVPPAMILYPMLPLGQRLAQGGSQEGGRAGYPPSWVPDARNLLIYPKVLGQGPGPPLLRSRPSVKRYRRGTIPVTHLKGDVTGNAGGPQPPSDPVGHLSE